MVIHKPTPAHKLFLKLRNRFLQSRSGIVSREKAPLTDDIFADLRFKVAQTSWRSSPPIRGLTLVKRAVLVLRSQSLISTVTAQRLIDATRSWEA